MSIYTIDANCTYMGEYCAESAESVLAQFAKEAGYNSVADMLEVTGIDDNVWFHKINTDALLSDYSKKTGKVLFQDSYGDGVAALSDGTRFDCYESIAAEINMTLDDFVMSSISESDVVRSMYAA
jgi:hypothetical protein